MYVDVPVCMNVMYVCNVNDVCTEGMYAYAYLFIFCSPGKTAYYWT